MKRYFIVAYFHERGWGRSLVITIGGEYVNEKKFIKEIREMVAGFDNIIIQNIIELSEQDYNDFTKEEL